MRTETFGHLDDDGELVDEKVVGGVNDDTDVVEVVVAYEVVVGVCRLTERTGEFRTESCYPTVKREKLFDGIYDGLLV